MTLVEIADFVLCNYGSEDLVIPDNGVLVRHLFLFLVIVETRSSPKFFIVKAADV